MELKLHKSLYRDNVSTLIYLCYRNAGDVLETFNFLENADDSDEEDEEGDLMEDASNRTDKQRARKHKIKVCCLYVRMFLG